MVYFTKLYQRGQESLVILNDKDETFAKGTILPIDEPYKHSNSRVRESFFLPQWSCEMPPHPQSSTQRWILQSSLHDKRPSKKPEQTLGHRMIKERVRWGSNFKFNGEFAYIKHYWEWLELAVARGQNILKGSSLLQAVMASLYTYDRNSDIMRAFCEAWCPTTNTLHTSSGEVSVSLWDMWLFGGLPIKGKFYDEVIPRYFELTGSSDRSDHLPKSCGYLFSAYHHIVSQQADKQQIPIKDWISFWFKGDGKYEKSSYRRSKRNSRPASTHNPDGVLPKARSWSEEEQALFSELGVEDEVKNETYLAAFLSCWLCAFVFPCKSIFFVRPGVFKMASLMAKGHAFNLAVPVLSNIYHGLGQVFQTPTWIGRTDICFPVHYVYGWLAHYFGTHFGLHTSVNGPLMAQFSGEGGAKSFDNIAARQLIHQGTSIAWHASLPTRDEAETIKDERGLPYNFSSFFLSLRSCYLSSRHGKVMNLEAYSPYRFGRQFGFYQDIPYDLPDNPPRPTLSNIFHHWKISSETVTSTAVYLPAVELNPHDQVTQSFRNWWEKKHGSYLEENLYLLASSYTPPSSKSKVHIDVNAKEIVLDNRVPVPEVVLEDRVPVPETTTCAKEKSRDNDGSSSNNDDRHWNRRKRVREPHNMGDTPLEQVHAPNEEVIQPKIADEDPHQEQGDVDTVFPEPSNLSTVEFVDAANRRAAIRMWTKAIDLLKSTPFENSCTLESDMEIIFRGISKNSALDLTPIRESVYAYLENIREYNDLRHTTNLQHNSLDEDQDLLKLKEDMESAFSEVQASKEKKDGLRKQFKDVSQQIKRLKVDRKKFSDLITVEEEFIRQRQQKASELEEAVRKAEQVHVASNDNRQTLVTLEEALVKARQALQDSNWAF